MSEDELPEGWTEAPLDQLIQPLETGSRPKGGVRGIQGGVPSVGGEHLDDAGGFSFDSIKYVPRKFYDGMRRGHIQIGDVLVVKDGATTGKVSLVRDSFPYPEAVVNEHVFICRPRDGVEPEFLFRFLYSPVGQRRILENFRGSAQGGINQSFAPNTAVPLAPLAEQERIVGAAEALLARVHAVRDRLDRVPAVLRRFRQSVLAAACDGRLTEDWRAAHPDAEPADVLLGRIEAERRQRLGKRYKAPAEPETDDLNDLPEGWASASLEGVTSQITSGPRDWTQYYGRGSGTFIMAQNVRKGVLDLSYRKAVDPPASDPSRERSQVEVGDLLVTIVGANTGDVCPVNEALPEHYVCQSVALLRPAEAGIAAFLNLLLNSPSHGRGYFDACNYGAGRPHLSFDQLRATPVALPPLEEQAEIVRRADALLALADRVGARVEAARLHAERTAQAVLAKAFRGELVPTEAELARAEGRGYETTDVLLARVAEDSKGTPKAKAPPAQTDAPDLFSQPPAASASGEVPGPLRDAADAGATTTPRELLSWFGQKRRGAVVVGRVRSALGALGAETRPDFAEAGFDDAVRLVCR